VLAIVRKHFGEHLVVLPEAATIIFGGGFPRESSTTPSSPSSSCADG
jgi:hypothetical protein